MKKFLKLSTAYLSAFCLVMTQFNSFSVSSETNILLGDINGDSRITAVDASMVLTEYVSTSSGHSAEFDEKQKKAADVQSDGRVDAQDASIILSYYAYCSVYDTISMHEFIFGKPETNVKPASIDLSEVPTFTENPYIMLNNNIPFFKAEKFGDESFEYYSPLDELERCGVCMACIGEDLMPTEERGSIGSVKPTGWHLEKYDIVDGKYLYNRCHLIGYQLTAENANTQNLITGTRYLNVDGMLPFENQTASYIEKTHNHVLYRVTPVFEGGDLVCRGVIMEAWSVEDGGAGLCFNVFCYNVQPGIVIDYASGDSYMSETVTTSITTTTTTTIIKKNTTVPETTTVVTTYPVETPTDSPETPYNNQSDYKFIANRKTKVYHFADCSSVKQMNDENKLGFNETAAEL